MLYTEEPARTTQTNILTPVCTADTHPLGQRTPRPELLFFISNICVRDCVRLLCLCVAGAHSIRRMERSHSRQQQHTWSWTSGYLVVDDVVLPAWRAKIAFAASAFIIRLVHKTFTCSGERLRVNCGWLNAVLWGFNGRVCRLPLLLAITASV